MDYHKATNYLDSLQSTNIKLGLERIRAACAMFGHPERKFPSVVVAGTNGKGSTCAFLESILRHNGLKVGLYTSPHLLDVRERIQIDRKLISKKDFAEFVGLIERMTHDARRITYFEFLTLLAFLYFAGQKVCPERSRGACPERSRGVDIAILEVGLGGRFDATNVVSPLVSIITRVGVDHEKYLGNTLEKIAFEKAGIIKEGVPVVTVDQDPEVTRVIRDVAEEKGSMLHVVSSYEVKYKLGLLGGHQNENAALAIRAAEIALHDYVVEGFSLPSSCGGLKPAATELALSTTRWPGRLEVVSKKPLVILDGAHNPNGAEALARFLLSKKGVAGFSLRSNMAQPKGCYSKIIAIFGAMGDKDIAGIVRPLLPVVDEWVITRPDMERAAQTEKIRKIVNSQIRKFGNSQGRFCELANLRIYEFTDVKTAIKRTLATMSKDDILIITGSLYMVADAKRF